MPKTNRLNRLLRQTEVLIDKDLKRIRTAKNGKRREFPPGHFSIELSRYANALTKIKLTTERLEDAQRAALLKMSKKELRKLAGLPDEEPNPVLENKKVSKTSKAVGEKAK